MAANKDSVQSEPDDKNGQISAFSLDSIVSDAGSDEVDLLEEIHLIFSHKPTDVDDASGKTVSPEDKEKHEMNKADHLFLNPFITGSDPFTTVPNDEQSQTIASYVIDRQDGIRIFFVNQVDVLFYDGGRVPVMYEIYNKHNQRLMVIDGRESACGTMEVSIIKGDEESRVVRGRIKAIGSCRFKLTDVYNDNKYIISLPRWVALFTCFLYCLSPCFRITRVVPTNDPRPPDDNHQHHSPNHRRRSSIVGKEIAVLGCKKWKDTFFKSDKMFCLHFLSKDELDPDGKLFLFAASLAFYHLYFKKPGRPMRCLLCHILLTIVLVLLGVLIYCFVVRWNWS